MGYMNEFPRSTTFDSDLREILEMVTKLSGEVRLDGYKVSYDNNTQTITITKEK